MTLRDIIKNKDYRSVYVLARYFYRIGEPFMEDGVYDDLERSLKIIAPDLEEYFNRSYDDDPIPVELLKSIGENPVLFASLSDKSELYRYLDEEKSNSIQSAVSYDEAYEYFKFLRDVQQDFVVSLKIDGLNTKMLYLDSEFAISLSRGRNGEAFDFTENSAKVMPRYIHGSKGYVKVTGESYVEQDGLEYLRNKYDSGKYKTCKSAAISMLRVTHDHEDYRYLTTRVFMAEGLAGTLDETFSTLESDGFHTPPHKLLHWVDIPQDFEEFKQWLKSEVMDPMWSLGQGIPSDGVVVEINDLLWEGDQKHQYSNRQHALKFEYWAFKYDKGIITDIVIEQRRVYKSVRVEIKPVVTYDGCEARYINTFDPSILISNDLYVGKEVYFERNSGAVNILIHGERLKTIKSSEVMTSELMTDAEDSFSE